MRQIISIALCLFAVGSVLFAQTTPATSQNSPQASAPVEQRVTVEFKIIDVGSAEMEILLMGSEPFLPVYQTFTLLGIKVDSLQLSQPRFEGFFRSGDSSYSIDTKGGRASYSNRSIALADNDFLTRENRLFVHLPVINALFGLDLKYLPRRLQVELKNSHTLPIYLAARRKQANQRLAAHLSIPEPDKYYGRKFEAFNGGRLDWTGTTRFSKEQFLGSRYTFELGTSMLGGDFEGKVISTVQSHQSKANWRGRMRFPVFDTPSLRQVVVGDFVSFGLLPRELTGFEITNRPPSVRHVFSRQVFSGQFEPNIDIGLSGGIEGFQLQHTDETGMYQLDAPILYGQGLMEVHAYDQWGQERVLQYRMNVPRTLIPPGEVEYSVAAGRFRPPSNIATSANYISWGVTPELTIGSKLDYYDIQGEVPKAYLGLTATARVTKSLFFNGLIVPTAFGKASLDWAFPSSAGIVLEHTRYARNLFFNPVRTLDETDLTLTLPFNLNSSKFSLAAFGARTHYTANRDDEIQVALSSYFSVFSPRISTRVLERSDYSDGTTVQVQTSDISLGMLLPASLLFRSEISYNHLSHLVETINADAVKRFTNGLVLGISYFRLPVIESYSIGVRIEYYFPFARAQAGIATPGSSRYEYTLASSGSVGLSAPASFFFFENHPNYVGYGGFMLRPFLDANGNGVADAGEQVVDKGRIYFANMNAGNQPRIFAGQAFTDDRILGYEDYNLFIDPQSLENPIWVPMFNTIRMLSEPNFMKRIDIPIVNGGFIRGVVTIASQPPRAAEAIKITLTSAGDSKTGVRRFSKTTSTFSTGEFEFSAVPPGEYTLELDGNQLDQLGFNVSPASRQIQVTVKAEGDVVADQDFKLTAK